MSFSFFIGNHKINRDIAGALTGAFVCLPGVRFFKRKSMKKTRDTIQLIIVMLCFVTFKRTDNVALQLSLYMVLNAIIIQEFIRIYNTERDVEKSNYTLVNDKYRYWRLVGIIILELFVMATVYYLSTIMIDSLKRL
jgi:hypothetical protein